jgi:hypothetical protein
MIDSYYCELNKKSLSEKWHLLKMMSNKWRHTLNLAAALIKESQRYSVSSKKMVIFLAKMQGSIASWTIRWVKAK